MLRVESSEIVGSGDNHDDDDDESNHEDDDGESIHEDDESNHDTVEKEIGLFIIIKIHCFKIDNSRIEVEEFTQEYRKQEKVSKILRIILSFLYLLYLSTYHCVIIYYSIHSF